MGKPKSQSFLLLKPESTKKEIKKFVPISVGPIRSRLHDDTPTSVSDWTRLPSKSRSMERLYKKTADENDISVNHLKDILWCFSTNAESHLMEHGDLNIMDMVELKVKMGVATELVYVELMSSQCSIQTCCN